MVSAEWFINGNLVETVLDPVLIFYEPGIYLIDLVAYNSEGCQYTTSINYQVLDNVTGLEDDYSYSIYPNPTGSKVFLDFSQQIQSVKLMSVAGKNILIYTSNFKVLILPKNIKSGLYILEIETHSQVTRHKIKVK